jgi:hypothetical protein
VNVHFYLVHKTVHGLSKLCIVLSDDLLVLLK